MINDTPNEEKTPTKNEQERISGVTMSVWLDMTKDMTENWKKKW